MDVAKTPAQAHLDEIYGPEEKTTSNIRAERCLQSRWKYFCHHVRWICRNIVNLEALESRKDLLVFKAKLVKTLWTYASALLKGSYSDKTAHSYVESILRILHSLESVMMREYLTPILSVGYLKHVQIVGTALITPHWSASSKALENDDRRRAIVQELSQLMISIYYNLVTLLHLLDMDLHNYIFYQCMGLVQKYHDLASGRGQVSFYDQHAPFLDESLGVFELIQEMMQPQSGQTHLVIPSSVTSLWVHEATLAKTMFNLYKSEL